MKTKAILATLLITAAASADARFAWPYPPKAGSPDQIGHWVVINGNAWPDSAESKLTRGTLAAVRRVRVAAATGPDAQKSSPAKKEKTQLKTGMFQSGLRHGLPSAWRSDS